MPTRTLALVGAAGGVGTTRLTVECGATLARAGHDVAALDAAFATQGLARYLDREIGPDAVALATGETTPAEALYDHSADLPGRLALCPAQASFERLAAAKRPAAAERLGDQIAAASLAHDAVLVDVPPVAANQALAALEAVDTVAVVTTDTARGQDALARQRERLLDLGFEPDAVVANRADGGRVSAHLSVPESDTSDPQGCPVCATPGGGAFAPAVAEVVETALGVTLSLDTGDEGLLDRLVG